MGMTSVAPARSERDGTRSTALEALRGIAALGVLARHAWSLDGTALRFTDRGFPELVIAQGAAGVWLFFALSGYVIAKPYVTAMMDGRELPHLGGYARRRVARIYPAYLVVLAVFLVFMGQDVVDDLWQIPVHALLLHNIFPGEQQAFYNVSWTLSLEILFYAAVPIVALVVRRATHRVVNVRTMVTAVCAIWIASVAWSLAAALMIVSETSVWLRAVLPSMLSMFCPGILFAIAEHAARTDERWGRRIAWVSQPAVAVPAVTLSIVVGALATTVTEPLIVYELARQSFAVGFGILIVAVARHPVGAGPVGRIAMWLGAISYGIYLWHGALAEIVYAYGVWVPATGPSLGAYALRTLYLVALTIPVAWLSWRYLEAPLIARARGSRLRV
jgi:peptidoglycan/LPS O-acetylase OafA/YrhL